MILKFIQHFGVFQKVNLNLSGENWIFDGKFQNYPTKIMILLDFWKKVFKKSKLLDVKCM